METVEIKNVKFTESGLLMRIEDCPTVSFKDFKIESVETQITESIIVVENSEFTMRNSSFNKCKVPNGVGGGIQVKNSLTDVQYCYFNNSEAYNGGGFAVIDPGEGTNYVIFDVFYGDTANLNGGGLYVEINTERDFQFELSNSTFEECAAENGYGGGLSIINTVEEDGEDSRRVLKEDRRFLIENLINYNNFEAHSSF